MLWNDRGVELVRVALARGDDLLEVRGKGVAPRALGVALAEPQAHGRSLTRAEGEVIMRRGFRAGVLRVHGRLPAMYDVVVDAVLDIGRRVGGAVQAPGVRLVLGEEQRRRALTAQLARTVVVMREIDDHGVPQRLAGV